MPAYADTSDDNVHAMLDAMVSLNGGKARIYTGSAPGIANAATGTLLAELILNATAFAAASARQRLANAIADVTALAGGVAGYMRLLTSGNVAKWEMRAGGSWIFTASSSSGLLLTTNVAHALANATAVQVYAEGAGVLPTGLAANTDYYVLNSSGTTLKLEATLGGGAIAYTDAGSGVLRLKLANVAAAMQSSDGSIAAGTTVGVSQIALRMPNVSV